MRSIVITKSFSLVELMVVVAIIGILSAIAVPSYKTYIIRTKFMELFSLAAPYQVEIAQALDTTGAPPANRLDVKNTSLVAEVGLYSDSAVETVHVYPQNFYPEWKRTDRFILLGKLQNDILTWTCCIHDTAGVPAKYMPSNCQTRCSVFGLIFT